VSFTFFTFIIPVFIKEMNTNVFIISGLVGLGTTLAFIAVIYNLSPSTRAEISLKKIIGIVLAIYTTINLFYFLKLIPPVPLALDSGIVAHNIVVENENYTVTYERDQWYVFWREHRLEFIHVPNESVYVFASIFAPTDIKVSIFHRWKWYDDNFKRWEIIDNIGYDINGGRDGGYRGYTFKNNVKPGFWKVEVITEEELVIGVIDFEIIISDDLDQPIGVVNKKF
jgi:hypothetical protein